MIPIVNQNLIALKNNQNLLRQQGSLWIKGNLFPHYLRLTIWIYGLNDYKSAFILLNNRILKLYKDQNSRGNLRMVYTYLKDCYTLLNSVTYSETRYTTTHRVKVDAKGIPKIIPVTLRDNLSEYRVLLGVQSLLGLHRVIGYFPKVDFSTITDDFTGISSTISIKRIEDSLNRLFSIAGCRSGYRLNLKPITGLIIETSGPNGPNSTRQIIADAFALTNDLNLLSNLIRWYYKYQGRRYILSLILILILGFPIWIIIRSNLLNGRLGVVYNQAGKARVVAMTNWWIQIALYPLHKSIFDLLRTLPTDGTFDQHKPIERLCEKGLPDRFHSLDLSAATDRLPLDLQCQILSLVTDDETSQLWRCLMSISYGYKGNIVKYAVGQPMGAYSSWAMLALTHHVIVQCCSDSSFQNYAILGDDIVIQDDLVSTKYLDIMKTLGVKISLHKSMISLNHLEFAKRIFTKEGKTISIIGPGLILSVVRMRALAGLLVSEGIVRSLFDFRLALRVLSGCPGLSPQHFDFGIWMLFGSRGILMKDQAAALNNGVSWLSSSRGHHLNSMRYALWNALNWKFLKVYNHSVTSAYKALSLWYLEFSSSRYNICKSKLFPIVLLKILLVGVSPAPWLYLDKLLCILGDQPLERIPKAGNWEDISLISDSIREISIDNTDFNSRVDVETLLRAYKEIDLEYKSTLRDLSEYGEDFY